MFRDARKVPKDRLIERDVCIVGAGAAGITIARELAQHGWSIALLESGGLRPDAATQALYRGQVEPGYLAEGSDYLATSRLRFFGGTTNHWTGLCGPLSGIDFEERSWIPDSGWPFDRAHLDPYYARATPVLELAPFDLEDSERKSLRFGSGIETVIKQLSPPTRFGPAFSGELGRHRKTEVFLNANITELHADDAASRIEWVRVASLDGNRFRVAARCFVLAAGAIENARLMLDSPSKGNNGLGNTHDLVGRYFMDHLFQPTEMGRVVLDAAPGAVEFYGWPRRSDASSGPATQGRLVLSEPMQREHRLPNNGVGLLPLSPTERVPLIRPVASLMRDLSGASGEPSYLGMLTANLEPVPDPENRILLDEERDALGMRRPRLHWNVTQRDREGALRYLQTFARELGRSLRGRARVELYPEYPWSRFSYSSHHMGTTRMHTDPKRGVVDANCRVHGLANLYVSGSSVFPTAGLVNPTFTIVALAIRLADHLGEVLPR